MRCTLIELQNANYYFLFSTHKHITDLVYNEEYHCAYR